MLDVKLLAVDMPGFWEIERRRQLVEGFDRPRRVRRLRRTQDLANPLFLVDAARGARLRRRLPQQFRQSRIRFKPNLKGVEVDVEALPRRLNLEARRLDHQSLRRTLRPPQFLFRSCDDRRDALLASQSEYQFRHRSASLVDAHYMGRESSGLSMNVGRARRHAVEVDEFASWARSRRRILSVRLFTINEIRGLAKRATLSFPGDSPCGIPALIASLEIPTPIHLARRCRQEQIPWTSNSRTG
jgi:hypothetical protein